nr:retrovirus-related Pol polyprotein from transposon TNT 1-94 [Tanacetum cinerariifolium]
MVAYLKKPSGSEGFQEIVDFLNANHIRYALTKNPTIYVSLIKKFWQTAIVIIVDNGEQEITATVDGKEFTVTEASVRRQLQLADVEDEAVYEEWDDKVERAATTATSLDEAQASGNILKTQSTTMPTVPFPQGTGAGGSPREVHSQEDQPKDQLGVLSVAKVLPDTARRNVQTYTRRGAVSTGSGRVSTASRMISTAEESVSTVGASMPVSTAGMVDKEEEWENIRARVEADEELTQRLQAEERNKYSEVDQAKMLVDLINQSKRYFVEHKAKAKRKKPVTQAQQRTYMSNKIKHMLWSLVKERFSSTKPTNDKERVLLVELKRLFEPDDNDELWESQKYFFDITWRLGILTQMLCPKLLVEEDGEMCRELIRKIFMQVTKKMKCLEASSKNKDFQENSDDEVDERSSKEYLRDLEIEYHERAPLANSKRFIKRKNIFPSQKANENTECYKCGNKGHFARDCFSKTSKPSYESPVNNYSSVSKGFQPKFTPKLIQAPSNLSNHTDSKLQKDYMTAYKKMKAKLSLLEDEEVDQVKVLIVLADDEITVGKSHAQNEQLKEEKRINKNWLTSSKKVSQCISEQIPHQKKKVLGGELLTESLSKININENAFIPASMGYDQEMVPKTKDWVERLNPDSILPNFNTRRILVPESQVGAFPSSEIMPLTFQPHSLKEILGLGIMKHTKPETQDSSNKSISETISVSETKQIKPSVPTEVKDTEQESKLNELTKLVQMLIDEKVDPKQTTQESSKIQKTESSKSVDSSRMSQDSKSKVQNTSSSKSLRPKPIQKPQLKFKLCHYTNHSFDDCYRILYCMICKREYHRTSDHEMYIASLKRSENYKAQPYQYASSSKQILKA